MAQDVQAFMQALGRLEQHGELDPIASLFAPDARIGNVLMGDPARGPAGARSFWQLYRNSFKQVTSRFEAIVRDGDRAALEWISTGTTLQGHPFEYRGVSMIEFSGEQIGRFHAYFDPAALFDRADARRETRSTPSSR